METFIQIRVYRTEQESKGLFPLASSLHACAASGNLHGSSPEQGVTATSSLANKAKEHVEAMQREGLPGHLWRGRCLSAGGWGDKEESPSSSTPGRKRTQDAIPLSHALLCPLTSNSPTKSN